MLSFDPLRFTKSTQALSTETQEMIAVAAYHLAQQRGFEPGHELEDWLTAEAKVETELALRRLQRLRAAIAADNRVFTRPQDQKSKSPV